jgi:hypothetical protein
LHVEDDTTSNGSGLQALEDTEAQVRIESKGRNADVLLELSQRLLFEEDLDLAASRDVNSLDRILAVSGGSERVNPRKL